jgi:MFS family permease
VLKERKDASTAHNSPFLKIHYGWIIILVGFLVLFACFGLARYAYAMLLPAMQNGLQLSYDQTGYIGTGNFIGYLVSVLLAPFALRHSRPRTTITCGLLLISLSLLAISRCTGFWQVFCLYTLTGIGGGFANIPLMILITYWFHRTRRGRALGLAIGGNGAGIVLAGLLIPYLNQGFGAAGWRVGWLVLGLICLSVTLVAGLLLRNSPAEMGLEPIGEPENCQTEQFVSYERTRDAGLLLRLGLIYAAFGATFMIYGTFLVTTMVREYHFSEAKAGFYWSYVGLFSLFSGVLFGGLSDRIGRKWGLALVLLVQTVAYTLVGMKLGGFWLIASIILYGLAVFAIPAIMTAAVAEYLGLSRAAAAFATVTLFFAAGQSIGPVVAGILARSTGSFSNAYLMAALLTLLGGVLAVLLPPSRSSRVHTR